MDDMHHGPGAKGRGVRPGAGRSPGKPVALIWVRREASRKSLQDIEAFLASAAVGPYAVGQAGSARFGYWTIIEVHDRRDLDAMRKTFGRLIDGWTELR